VYGSGSLIINIDGIAYCAGDDEIIPREGKDEA